MTSVARAEPSSIITALANGHASQMGANTEHDQPFGLLGTGIVGFGVTERFDVNTIGFFNLFGGTMTNEDWLSTPLDDDVLAWVVAKGYGRYI